MVIYNGKPDSIMLSIYLPLYAKNDIILSNVWHFDKGVSNKMIKLITDTGADLAPEVFDSHDIAYLPISVHIDDAAFADRVEIQPREFYEKLSQTKSAPTTSRIPPYAYEKLFEQYLKTHDEILCITFSSCLSAIHESAVMAAGAIAPERITVVDSKAASLGQGLLVLKAAELIKAGRSRSEIAEEVTEMSRRLEHIFACGSLEMLKRGGRVSTVKALVGTVLRVIPILQFEEGRIVPFENVRGTRRMIQFMLETMERRGREWEEQVIGISHADYPEMAIQLADEIRARFRPREIIISEIGAAIGSHSGPKTLALFFQR